jgi:copper(I)-binding protein
MLKPLFRIGRAAGLAALAALALVSSASLLQAQHSHGPRTYQQGSVAIEEPWSRATPGGAKVGAGYMRIVNRGAEPDRLTGGTTEAAGGFEVHETSTVDGVARMRPVAGGLVIKPGETVELKPGGLHVMLTGLKRPLKEGDTVSGTLVFEKAGTVTIEYKVGAVGAQGASANHHH